MALCESTGNFLAFFLKPLQEGEKDFNLLVGWSPPVGEV